MKIELQAVPTAAFAGVMVCWFVFAGVFLLRKKPPQAAERKRERASLLGIALQGMGYAAVWTLRRPFFSPMPAEESSP